jgi:Rrf2 family protein
MMLSRASQYAIHALVAMVGPQSKQPVASHKVAQAKGIPEGFLLKILKPLVDVGVLQSIKGPHGGYRLARSATEINLRLIIETVDGAINGQRTVYKDTKAPALDKHLAGIFERAEEAGQLQLAKVRLSDLVSRG